MGSRENMEIRRFVVGAIETNCYFLTEKKSRETLVCDPGAEADRLGREVRSLGLRPVAVLLTHAHWDHIDGVSSFTKEFPVPVYLSEGERPTLSDPSVNLSEALGGTAKTYHADKFLSDGEETTIGSFRFQCLSTPGHTPGGACYYFPEEGILLSGDSLFAGSVGRTDFPGGSMSALVRSLKKKVMTLPEDVLVLPGHGPETSVGEEKRVNPYLSGGEL